MFDGVLHTDVKTTLLKMANLIETRGHAQGELISDTGGLCIMGAFGVATLGDVDLYSVNPWNDPLAVEVEKTILAKLGVTDPIGMWCDVCDYNNTHTRAECVDLLRRAAA